MLPNNGGKPVVEGQSVAEGDVLVQLESTAVVANLAKAEAARKVVLAERKVADISLKQAVLDLKSLEELKRTQAQTVLVSPIMIEKGKLAVEAAQAAVRALDRKLEAADQERRLPPSWNSNFTRSPHPARDGWDACRSCSARLFPQGRPIAEVVDIDNEIDVLCFVSAADARSLQLGQTAHIGGVEDNPATKAVADGREGSLHCRSSRDRNRLLCRENTFSQ